MTKAKFVGTASLPWTAVTQSKNLRWVGSLSLTTPTYSANPAGNKSAPSRESEFGTLDIDIQFRTSLGHRPGTTATSANTTLPECKQVQSIRPLGEKPKVQSSCPCFLVCFEHLSDVIGHVSAEARHDLSSPRLLSQCHCFLLGATIFSIFSAGSLEEEGDCLRYPPLQTRMSGVSCLDPSSPPAPVVAPA